MPILQNCHTICIFLGNPENRVVGRGRDEGNWEAELGLS